MYDACLPSAGEGYEMSEERRRRVQGAGENVFLHFFSEKELNSRPNKFCFRKRND